MDKSLEKNKKKIEFGKNEINSDLKAKKRYKILESLFDDEIDEFANTVNKFEKSFQLEIDPVSPKRLTK